MPKQHLYPYIVLSAALMAAVALRILAKRLKSRADPRARAWPLEPKRYVLTEPERELYRRLIQGLPNSIVLAQVQLLRVVNFTRGRQSYAVLNRISQLSLDFLILGPDSCPIAAIELDDSTHKRPDRRRADANKSHALRSAGIPLIRWQARSLPDPATIASALRDAIAWTDTAR